ncbi:class I SAM-dependent methyltransferase [Nocardia brevicatena]|uniref:class I SAM-dependent methyltransferase n=1 Tax=Nocardia brevicatena TaxID=37327 RepID=UPI00030D35B3|nr:class I SAM-dependent methyltransferase [Nocardia brevicatena]
MNLARRTMNAPAWAAVYERVWRPAVFYLATGRTTTYATRTLRLDFARRVLDIACGPGNFTWHPSERLPEDGFAVGVDHSPPMPARALADNSGPRVGYLRGDARHLPFPDATFDAACCFGALYLIPDPLIATREMIRVPAPGGRIAITAGHRADSLVGEITRFAGSLSDLRVFDGHVFPDLFTECGLVEVKQQVHRTFQYLTAVHPAEPE